MGCDIHMWFEVKKTGKWEPAEVRVPCRLCGFTASKPCRYCLDTKRMWPGKRDYAVFNLLAGVRGDPDEDPTPISPPRGLPADLADHPRDVEDDFYETWDLRDQVDLHSKSWLLLSELEAHRARFPADAEMLVVMDEMAKLGAPEDVRMVFAFDN